MSKSKNIGKWLILIMLPLTAFLASCANNDDAEPTAPEERESFIAYEGQKFELNHGYWEDLGKNPLFDSYAIDLFFTDQPYDLENITLGNYTKIYLSLDLNTSENRMLVAGTYVLDQEDNDGNGFIDRLPNTISYVSVIIDMEYDESGEPDFTNLKSFFEPISAIVKIEKKHDQYTIEYDVIFENNFSIFGVVNGSLEELVF